LKALRDADPLAFQQTTLGDQSQNPAENLFVVGARFQRPRAQAAANSRP